MWCWCSLHALLLRQPGHATAARMCGRTGVRQRLYRHAPSVVLRPCCHVPLCAHLPVQILAKAHATTARIWALAAALAAALIAFAVRAVVTAMAGAPVAT